MSSNRTVNREFDRVNQLFNWLNRVNRVLIRLARSISESKTVPSFNDILLLCQTLSPPICMSYYGNIRFCRQLSWWNSALLLANRRRRAMGQASYQASITGYMHIIVSSAACLFLWIFQQTKIDFFVSGPGANSSAFAKAPDGASKLSCKVQDLAHISTWNLTTKTPETTPTGDS